MLDIVNHHFDGVLVFYVIIWDPLCEHGVIELCNISIECRFLHGVCVFVLMYTLMMVGNAATLLPRLGLITHGDFFS